ncbi:MAG: NAD(P)H-binding protein [Cytophagales bacterium]|nr:NAD(P)H-binding protein [Cytophagales bacterium]
MAVAIIAGATGLVGSHVLELLLQNDAYEKVVALSRKPLSIHHQKLQNLVVDFDNLEAHTEGLRGDDVYCCLGTTIRQAGTKGAFRKVDFDYPITLARIAQRQGASQYLIVTALGSDPRSSIFYNRVKGEVEETLRALGFDSLHIFQPSMLLGPRTEQRAGESAGKWIMTRLDFLIPKKYKAIVSTRVARAMVAVAVSRTPGNHVHVSGELQGY